MSRLTQGEFDTGRFTGVCAASGRPIAPGDPYVAALFEVEGPQPLVRRDYLARAWESLPRPPGLFASWRGVARAPRKDGRAPIDADAVMGLFEQLEGASDPKRLAFRFVLALILLRKRLLSPAGSRAGALLVRRRGEPADAPPVEVIDPGMDEQTVADITARVRSLLGLDE